MKNWLKLEGVKIINKNYIEHDFQFSEALLKRYFFKRSLLNSSWLDSNVTLKSHQVKNESPLKIATSFQFKTLSVGFQWLLLAATRFEI